jgi:excisionase family DNA binding protein
MTTLDLQGAAALMKIHPVTLGRMINDGKIPATRIGRAYVMLERDVLGYVEQQIAAQTARKAGRDSRSLPLDSLPMPGVRTRKDIGRQGCASGFFTSVAWLRLFSGGPCGAAERLAGSYVPVFSPPHGSASPL